MVDKLGFLSKAAPYNQGARRVKIVLSILTIFFFGTLFSYSASACSSTTCTGKVARLYMKDDNPQRVYIRTDQTHANLNCIRPVDGEYVTLFETHQNFEEIYSVLIAAQFANRAITIRIVESSQDCSISYLLLDS